MTNEAKLAALRYVVPAVAVGVLIAGAAIGAQTMTKPKAPAQASTTTPAKAKATAAPARLPGYSADRNAYYGDLHVHTYLSNDAYIFNLRRTPDDAYRFARGEAIGHASGYTVRLAGGPLDFVAVTDHAEFLAAVREAGIEGTPLSRLEFSKGLFSPDPDEIQKAFARPRSSTTLASRHEHGPRYATPPRATISPAASRHLSVMSTLLRRTVGTYIAM